MTSRKSKERSSILKSDIEEFEGAEATKTDVAEPETAAAQEPAENPVGMIPYTWCGVEMFRCPSCFETTQNSGEAHSHVCKPMNTV